MEHRVDNGGLIDGHRQRPADVHIIQRRFLRIKRQETGIQPGFAHQVNIFIGFHARQVRRVRERHYLTLVLFNFGKTYGGIRRDGKHQPVQL